MASQVCPGCLHTFTMVGYTRHLSQTERPSCIAVREERDSYFPGLSDLHGRSDDLDTYRMSDVTAPPRIFEGDHFGLATEYDNDDLPWPEEEALQVPPPEPESDSDSDAEDLPIEDAPLYTLPPLVFDRASTPEPMDEEGPEDQLAVERCRKMRESVQRLCQKPAVVVRFGGEAGKVISEPSTVSDQGDQYDNLTYQSVLGHDAQGNPWYPFNSKLDWEVAKWAKLRGPSDTAFSELLAIEGVSKRSTVGMALTDQ